MTMDRRVFAEHISLNMGVNRPRARGFTLMESLVVIGILIILLSIFIPYLMSIRETSRRATCADNLRHIRVSMQDYARDHMGEYPRVVYDPVGKPDGYVAFTGPDDPNAFAAGSAVQPSDVTASLWLLVRGNYITDTRVFICPSSDDSRDLMTDASGSLVTPLQRGNFGRRINLSYSYADPFSSTPGYRLNDTKPAEFVLMADKNPGQLAAEIEANADAKEMSKANSLNHGGAGQNVLYAYGGVFFVKTPYCGIGHDNIYTARAASVRLATQPTTVAANVRGFVGSRYGPVQNDDSYLVPTAEDVRPTLTIKPTTTTAPATTTTATSIPSTEPAPTTEPQPASLPATTGAATTTTSPSR